MRSIPWFAKDTEQLVRGDWANLPDSTLVTTCAVSLDQTLYNIVLAPGRSPIYFRQPVPPGVDFRTLVPTPVATGKR